MLDLLIDLDNTMYSETDSIFSQVDERMKKFISDKLNIGLPEAYDIQKKYFINHGTTLRGLMLHHGIKPEPFLSYVHDIDLTAIQKNNFLKKLLDSYTGKKIIFTNGTNIHASNVLKRIGVNKSVDSIFDIADADYIPKPEKNTYIKVIKKFNLNTPNTLMIDDIPINLKTANQLGIKTILIKKENDKNYNYIDYISCDISDVINKLIKKEIFI